MLNANLRSRNLESKCEEGNKLQLGIRAIDKNYYMLDDRQYKKQLYDISAMV